MALPPLAQVEQLEDWLGYPVSGSAAGLMRAEAVLSAASALVRSHKGTTYVDDDGALLDDIPDVVGVVVVQCAARVYRNPEGKTQDTTGPFSSSYGPDAANGLYLTSVEKEMLAGPSAGPLTSVRVEAPELAAGRPRTSYEWWCYEGDE